MRGSSSARSRRNTSSRRAPDGSDKSIGISRAVRGPSAASAAARARSGLVGCSLMWTRRKSGRGVSASAASTLMVSPTSRASTAIRSAIARSTGDVESTRSAMARCAAGTAATSVRAAALLVHPARELVPAIPDMFVTPSWLATTCSIFEQRAACDPATSRHHRQAPARAHA